MEQQPKEEKKCWMGWVCVARQSSAVASRRKQSSTQSSQWRVDWFFLWLAASLSLVGAAFVDFFSFRFLPFNQRLKKGPLKKRTNQLHSLSFVLLNWIELLFLLLFASFGGAPAAGSGHNPQQSKQQEQQSNSTFFFSLNFFSFVERERNGEKRRGRVTNHSFTNQALFIHDWFLSCRIQLNKHIQSNLSILKEKIGIELCVVGAVRPSINNFISFHYWFHYFYNSRRRQRQLKKTKPISLLRILINECARRRRDCLFCLPAALSFFSNEIISLKRRRARQQRRNQSFNSISSSRAAGEEKWNWLISLTALALGAPFIVFSSIAQQIPFQPSKLSFIPFICFHSRKTIHSLLIGLVVVVVLSSLRSIGRCPPHNPQKKRQHNQPTGLTRSIFFSWREKNGLALPAPSIKIKDF